VGNNGSRKNLENDLPQCQIVQHKSHMDWPVIEPSPVW